MEMSRYTETESQLVECQTLISPDGHGIFITKTDPTNPLQRQGDVIPIALLKRHPKFPSREIWQWADSTAMFNIPVPEDEDDPYTSMRRSLSMTKDWRDGKYQKGIFIDNSSKITSLSRHCRDHLRGEALITTTINGRDGPLMAICIVNNIRSFDMRSLDNEEVELLNTPHMKILNPEQ